MHKSTENLFISLESLNTINSLESVIAKLNPKQQSYFLNCVNMSLHYYNEIRDSHLIDINELKQQLLSIRKTLDFKNEVSYQNVVLEDSETNNMETYKLVGRSKSLKNLQLEVLENSFIEKQNDEGIQLSKLREYLEILSDSVSEINPSNVENLKVKDNKKSTKELDFIKILYSHFKQITGITTKYITDSIDDKVGGPFFDLVRFCFEKSNQPQSDISLKRKISIALKNS